MHRPVLPRRLAYVTVIYGLTMLVATGTVPLGLWTAYAREFHFSAAVLTFLASSTLFGVLVAVLLFGNLSDRIGRRAVLIPGVLLGALSLVLFVFANGVPMLFAGRVTSGLAVGLFTGAGTAALTELVPPGGDTRRAATHAATTSIAGFAMGPLIGGIFVQYGPYPLQARLRRLPRLPPAAPRRRHLPARDGAQPPALQDPAAEGRRAARGQVDLRPRLARRLLLLLRRLLLPVARPDRRDRDPRRLEPAPRGDGRRLLPRLVGARADRHARAADQDGDAVRPRPPARPASLFVLFALLTDNRPFFVVGALVGGFGQGLAYLGGQSLVEKVAPADQRSEVFSLYMIVLYVSGSTAAITFGLIAKWIGLNDAALLYASFVVTITTCTLVVALRSGLLPSARASARSCPSPRRRRPRACRVGTCRLAARAGTAARSAPLTSSGDQAPLSRYQRLTQLPAPSSAFVTSFGSTSGSIWPARCPSAITDARPSSYAAPWRGGDGLVLRAQRARLVQDQRAAVPVRRHPGDVQVDQPLQLRERVVVARQHLLEALEQEAVDVLHELEEQRLLRVDVVVDAAALDAEALGDLGRRGRLVALLGEELGGDAQHLRPAAVLARLQLRARCSRDRGGAPTPRRPRSSARGSGRRAAAGRRRSSRTAFPDGVIAFALLTHTPERPGSPDCVPGSHQ